MAAYFVAPVEHSLRCTIYKYTSVGSRGAPRMRLILFALHEWVLEG